MKIGDNFYNPYDPKNLNICKGILKDKAQGNYEEALRRGTHLVLWNKVDPNYYKVTPQDLAGKWTALNEPPQAAPGMAGLRASVFQSEMEKLKEGLRNGQADG